MRGSFFKTGLALSHGTFDNFITIRTYIDTIIASNCIHNHVVCIYAQSTIFCITTIFTECLITAPWLCIAFYAWISASSILSDKMTVIKITKSTSRGSLTHITLVTCITNLILIKCTSWTVKINSSAACASVWAIWIGLIIIISCTIFT